MRMTVNYTYCRDNSFEQRHIFKRDKTVLYHWFTSWQIKVNFEKCEILHLGRNNLQFQNTLNDRVGRPNKFCRDLEHCLSIARIAH